MAKKVPELIEARASGAPMYFTGRPCKEGHVALRLTSNSTCMECSKRHGKTSREKNPGRVQEWVAKNIEQVRATRAAWKLANPEKHKANVGRYYQNHKAEKLAYGAAWRETNAAKFQAARENWYAANRDQARASKRNRRRSVRLAEVRWADKARIASINRQAAELTRATGVPHEVDHIIPVVHPLVCGLHCQDNLQVLTAEQNRKKSNSFDPAQFEG